ncbi:MAG: hydantoinase/oxoprolinase family protein [Candidatus Marinimicrobia bacterium]|jgi:N-methylhydantoinase A|nr:hydantoinase/oxoprolinase family protein [Candidatus Neomarinimicrobiota bacterium]MBT3635006.1 hydantoinase/oxoprolinase family protein [Candidatus Neomarinimicrobiota bacterium]MBT3683837.1 hydantoinase/oxoprolinase family protein [Candidatus Neomarinimicrobiota bacterium]MBT3760658.1 hydantoinase/oxoprolinase family protein [Candidatus Neomarinimicrobiota bacterium]MBT3896847.1 hydantoinase/oxoprolinase family protein [Candidatus Neomarinimicrobiota bacterium]
MASTAIRTSYKIGIDVGGTFTDLVALNEQTGEIHTLKSHSVPAHPGIGVLHAIKKFLKYHPGNISLLVHASTIGTNLFLGQMGLTIPKVVLITTKGFADVIEIGRQKRAEVYNPYFHKPKSLIDKPYRFTLDERINAGGDIIRAIQMPELENLAAKIIDNDIEAVAISFLHSYKNNQHEIFVRDYLQKKRPDLPIVMSCEVDPEYREYERTSTTVLNAMLIPVISTYLQNILNGLKKIDISCPIQVMQSNGGLASIDSACTLPVATIESGPATGVNAAAHLGTVLGLDKILCFDMGGTTAKAGAVINGEAQMIHEYEVGGEVHAGRMIKGSGYPVRYPFIDLAEISAGGGTIAHIDDFGQLKVGPVSAGADPGPACYEKGGEHATITDANLILGRLNPSGLSGGDVAISLNAAQKVFEGQLLPTLDISLEDCAVGIIDIVNQQMIRALRLISVERGYDPRDFVLLAYGGGGPNHAAAIAEGFGVKTILVPPNPGVFSAMGLLIADFRKDYKFCLLGDFAGTSVSLILEHIQILKTRAGVEFFKEGFGEKDIRYASHLELRYAGQSFEISIPWSGEKIDMAALFHQRHNQMYGYASPEDGLELVNIVLTVTGITDKPDMYSSSKKSKNVSGPSYSTRKVYFKNIGWTECKIYQRQDFYCGFTDEGPVIIEQYDSTTLIPPQWLFHVDEYGNLHLHRQGDDHD